MLYYVNKNAQVNGDHEVHKSGCHRMPEAQNCMYLGDFSNCHDAIITAKDFIHNQMAVFIVQENAILDNLRLHRSARPKVARYCV